MLTDTVKLSRSQTVNKTSSEDDLAANYRQLRSTDREGGRKKKKDRHQWTRQKWLEMAELTNSTKVLIRAALCKITGGWD